MNPISAPIGRRNGPSDASASAAVASCSTGWSERDFSVVSAEALDDRSGFEFASQIFIDDKPAYYDFANKTHNMTGAEVFAAFAPAEAKG